MTGRSLLALAVGVIGCAPGEGSDLVIRDAFGFAPVSITEAAVYFTVENGSTAPDTLLGVSAPIAEAAMIHEGSADGGPTQMDPVGGVVIPGHASLVLRPGGPHAMLVGLARLPRPGDTIQVTLRFARSGERTVAVPLIAYGDPPPPEGWGGRMQWWCAASSADWSWTWRAYPGVWLAVFGLGLAYARLTRRLPRAERRWLHWASFALGLLLLWAALDWPLGALGAGYLLSAHTVQFVLLTLVVVPLLLASVPAVLPRRWPAGRPLLRRLAHPALGLAGYTGAMGITHIPVVTDTLMASQLGSLAIDLVWIAGGVLLWWPVLAPDPLGRMSPPLRIGYLFLATIPPTVPAAFMVFADYPLYGLFELAPRVRNITAVADQQAAGLIMKVGADPLVWLAMGIIFFRWQFQEERAERAIGEGMER